MALDYRLHVRYNAMSVALIITTRRDSVKLIVLGTSEIYIRYYILCNRTLEPRAASTHLLVRVETTQSKVHGANIGPPGPVGPRWAPCWPHEPCYQGTFMGNIRTKHLVKEYKVFFINGTNQYLYMSQTLKFPMSRQR